MVASLAVVGGEQTRAAVFAQPAWLQGVAERVGGRRLPSGRLLFTGCGTSYHAAQVGAHLAGGEARQALELVLRPRDADLLVAISHAGETPLTVEAARAFDGPVWLLTAAGDAPLAALADEVVLTAPERERSSCHTASYTAALATLATLAGLDATGAAPAVAAALEAPLSPSDHDRWLVAGAGRDWPTAQEATLKLREGTFVAAEAHQTEELLHGHLAAVDERVRAFVLEGEGRARERSADAARALAAIGCDTTVLPQSPDPALREILAIVPFHLLVLDVAARRGVDPDRIRRDDERWARARAAYR